jgi:hypothetical protein
VNAGVPRLASWILERCIPDYRCDSFMGDLIEQYQERGVWWYWRQALHAVRAQAVRTVMTATETEVSAAEFVGDLVLWIALAICGFYQLSICALFLLRWTHIAKSDLTLFIGAALIGSTMIAAAGAAHVIRTRRALTRHS